MDQSRPPRKPPTDAANDAPIDRRGARDRAELQCRLARAWRKQGRLDRAALSFRRAFDLDPTLAPAAIELGGVLREQGDVQAAIATLREGLERSPGSAELHKALVDALVAHEGTAAACRQYGLERRDEKPIAIEEGEVICLTAVRNEAARLPHFLSYYRSLGITRFLVVDNASTDGTDELLLAEPDVHLWRSPHSFNRANFGAAWFEVLLREHGIGRWCAIVDADELLIYPDCEQQSVPELCGALDRKGKRALSAVLLDMYADRPIRDTHYTPGQPFLYVCRYFDRQFYHERYEGWSPYRNQDCYFGGARRRVFGEQGAYNLSKVALLKYDLDCVLIGGQHWTNLPRTAIADETACLLHFKYFSTFPEYVNREVARREHYGDGMQYAQYAVSLAGDAALTLYDPAHSIRYENSAQLEALGIVRRDPGTQPQITGAPPTLAVEFPPIAAPPPDAVRPFWSVMITAYDRVDYLARALRSVLDQAPEPDAMQIEVVNDAADRDAQDRLERLVHELGGDRVRFHRHPTHLGHPHIFNLCIERARGRWIHILHDDDWVEHGFYEALRAGIERAPDLGAAFCRQIRVNEAGERRWTSWLEREGAGPLEGWLDRIAVMCRLQFVSIAVRRSAYETLGGFCPQAGSAFDWDMWKRIAVRFPLWYEPRPLACFLQGARSETHRLARSGEQIAHARRAIEIAERYLPADRVVELSRRARQHQAAYALDLARRQLRRGDRSAAIANIREGLRCSPTHALEEALVALLAGAERSEPAAIVAH